MTTAFSIIGKLTVLALAGFLEGLFSYAFTASVMHAEHPHASIGVVVAILTLYMFPGLRRFMFGDQP